ncbi:MAG: ECF transporter S component [Chloroflexota bacterium]
MRFSVRDLTRAAMLLALALVIQMLRLPQLVTGPAINAILLLAVPLVGGLAGVLIGFVTPWVAVLTGIIAAPLAPFAPFIMVGNASLSLVYAALRRVNSWLAVGAAAVVKFLWLTLSVKYIAALFNVKVPPKAVATFQLPQLYTALAGGLVAIALLALPAMKRLTDKQTDLSH